MKTVKTYSLINTGISLVFETLVPTLAFYAPVVVEAIRHVVSCINRYMLNYSVK